MSPTPSTATRRVPPPRADRRLNILLAAEKLFGIHGYHAVSIRDIAAEAGVPLALVGYHYGAKHELYLAIFESWQGVIDERLSALQAALADGHTSDLIERIVDAFVSPVITLHRSEEGQYFARMAALDLVAPSPELDRAMGETFDPMAHAFIDALAQASPQATRAQAVWCYQFMLGTMLYFLLSGERAERLSRGEIPPGDPASKNHLLRYIAAGIRGTLGRDSAMGP